MGLYALYLLLLIQPFHFIISEQFSYYREGFSAVFYLLLIYYYQKTGFIKRMDYRIRKETFYLLLFCLLLIIFAFIDSGVNLYEADYTEASLHLTTISPNLYIIRNALIYVPMVLYFAAIGLREDEIKRIAMIIVIVAPFSIWAFLTHYGIATIETIGVILGLHGFGLSYNSYVPYLTFPAIASLFLLTTDTSKFLKIFYALITAFLALYILVSTSRQSLLFVLIAACFFLFNFTGSIKLKMISLLLVITTLAWLIFIQIGSGFEISNKITDRYGSIVGTIETPRLEIFQEGLGLLNFYEYLSGAGLSSVVVSGPHNDYIRWLQRIGLIGMIIGFMPFVIGFRKAFTFIRMYKNRPVYVFIFLAMTFTLYHSLFGYPREDAYQSLYCFLGLAIWLGFRKTDLDQKLVEKSIPRSVHQAI